MAWVLSISCATLCHDQQQQRGYHDQTTKYMQTLLE